jgi:CheY-like chemotaxis protein
MPHKILVLKDRPEYIAALKTLIEPHGFAVIATGNVEEALRVLHSQDLDMIVVAIHLQEGNVFDFIRIVRMDANVRINSLPIICLNLNPELHAPHLNESLKTSAKSLGANRFITMEPYDPSVLWTEIEKFLPRESVKVASASTSCDDQFRHSENT